MSSDAAVASKFLRSNWTCYELTDWQMLYSDHGYYCLLRFIKCFESLAAHCSVQAFPLAFDHLLCANISIVPNLQRMLQAKKNKAVNKNEKIGSGSAKQPPESQELKSLSNKVAGYKKPMTFKVVLDWCSELLLVNRRLPSWLEDDIGRCFGCAKLSVVCVFSGDARHLLQLRCQKGTQGDDVKSAQAILEVFLA
ncbi:hypothetical protein FHG87_021153 [Trinorchestia longiramus]|nr:hypothetical protein FHG87_021153 [Trinorchestia longiramus]